MYIEFFFNCFQTCILLLQFFYFILFKLRLLPKQISKLENLSILKIERNQLRQLPPGLGNLSNLR